MPILHNSIIAAADAADPVTRSLRFDGTADLERTTGSTNTTWTVSMWAKRAELGTNQYIFSWGGDGVRFDTSDRISVWNGSAYRYTTAVFRDVSSWYNIVLSCNSGTLTVIVNGTTHALSSSTTYPAWGTVYFGAWSANSTFFKGYLADIYGIEGSALDHTSFTESNGYGGLKPKAYTGSFGTNGFHLKLDDSSDIGADDAGSNDFATTNLSSHDVCRDTPTSNFCTFSPISGPPRGTSTTISEGNLKVVGGYSGSYFPRVMGTVAVSSGKWFYEVRCVSNHTNSREYGFKGINTSWPAGSHGLAGGSNSTTWANESEMAFSAYHSGVKFGNSSSPATSGTSWGSAGDVIGLALDLDSTSATRIGTLRVFKNGSEIVSATDIPTGASTEWLPCIDPTSYGPQTAVANFGQDPTFGGLESGTTYTSDNTTGVVGEFHNPIPSGYLPFAAGNLGTTVTPSEHFDILTYNGNSDIYNSNTSTQNVTGVNFDVGMAWIKDRDNRASETYTGNQTDEYGNYLFDTVTGTSTGGYNIDFDVTSGMDGPELNSGYYGVTSFGAGSGANRGITVDEAGETNFKYDDGMGEMGESFTERYVAWLWKLGSTGSSSTWNSSYTAPTTEHYNASAGVTTIDVAPASSGNLEVAHSLSAAPEFFFVTSDMYAENFSGYYAFHKDLSSGNYLYLDGNSAQASDTTVFPSGAAHADYIKLGSTFADEMGDGFNLRIWAFTGVEGYSKFGSYTPNGNANGPFIYTGFRPAFVMTKWTGSYGGGQGWSIKDSTRDTYNPALNLLHPNSSGAEGTNEAIDLISNGFKIRANNNTINSPNGSAKYIFAAFAESPFSKSNAR